MGEFYIFGLGKVYDFIECFLAVIFLNRVLFFVVDMVVCCDEDMDCVCSFLLLVV